LQQQNELWGESSFAQASEPEVSTQLAKFLPGFSRLSAADISIFSELFQKEELCYANSWLYFLRAARNDQGDFGYKFVSEDMVAGIGYRDHSFYIVHPIGVSRYTRLIDLCMKIYEINPGPIILKKIDQTLYKQIVEVQPFFIDRTNISLFEEEAFPEHILQLERLFAPVPEMKQRLQPFLKKVQRFERQAKLWPVQGVAWKDLRSNPGFQGLFGGSWDKYKSYAHIIKEASSIKDNGRYKVCSYYDERGIIQGLYVSERFREGISGLYCAVSTKVFPGVTEWMDYDFFQQLFYEGIHTLYLGGSETEGVHRYVQKLLPIMPSYLMRPMLIGPG
jgi:hypothetical protein